MKDILFTGKIPITSSNGEIPWQMKCDITQSDELVEIRLIDTRDIFTFYVCSLTPSDFYVLKREQDLVVDYDKFIPNLVKLFHAVSTNRLFALFSKETSNFMFVEKSEFRNIVRFELKFVKPDETHYKRYLSDIIDRMESDNIKLIKENGMLKEQCIVGDRQMKDRIGYLEEELNNYKTKVERLHQENDRLTKESYNRGSELKDIKSKLIVLEKENSTLTYEIEKARLEIVKNKSSQERNNELEKELAGLKGEIETANDIIRKLKEENGKLKESLEKQEESDKTLKNENKRFKSDLEETKRKNKSLEDKLKKAREEQRKREEQTKQLENDNEALLKRLENAKSVYTHFYNKNVDRKDFSDESSTFSIHPESPP